MSVEVPPVNFGQVLAQIHGNLSREVEESEDYERRRRALCLSPRPDEPAPPPSSSLPEEAIRPAIRLQARGPLADSNYITRTFELNRWFAPHLPSRPVRNLLPTRSSFLKRFVCTTITTTVLAKVFFAGFNPWVTGILVFGHTLQNRVVYDLYHAYADSASRLRRTRNAQNLSLEGLFYAVTLVAFGALSCTVLNLRLTTFATYYLFTVISEKFTFGILNAAAYWYASEPEESADIRDVRARRRD